MADFFTLITNIGRTKIAAFASGGPAVQLTEVAVGDGLAGAYYTPTESQLSLKHEVWRSAINNITNPPGNPGHIIVDCVIPADVGGWTIREVGLFDAAGDLIGVGKYPESYKPALVSGVGKEVYLRPIFDVVNAAAITLLIDPAIVTATREYAETVAGAAVSAHLASTDPHPQYATDLNLSDHASVAASELAAGHLLLATILEALAGTDATKAITPAGLKAAIDAFHTWLIGATPGTIDQINEIATALGNDPNFVTTITTALGLKAPLNSPALVTPTATTTPAAGNDSLLLATTAFVKTAINNAKGPEATLTDQATITWDWSNQSNAKVTLGGNRTLGAPSNLAAGEYASIRIIQDGTGNRALTFNSAYKGVTELVLSTTAGYVDWVLFRAVDGTNCELIGYRTNVGA